MTQSATTGNGQGHAPEQDTILPPEDLRAYIKYYRLQEADIHTDGLWVPAWTHNFLFLNYGQVYDMQTKNGPMIRGYRAMLTGVLTRPARGVVPFIEKRAFVVELQPFAAYAWIGSAVASIVDGSIDAASLLPGGGASLFEQVHLPFQEKASLVSDVLRSVFHSRKRFEHEGLSRALDILNQHANQRSIESRMEDAGLSTRHFRRLFKKVTGVSPKLYSRIVRMEQMLQEFHRNPDLKYLERVHGFYDQSHFIREFKRFTNTTPRNLIRAFQEMPVRQVHSNLKSPQPGPPPGLSS